MSPRAGRRAASRRACRIRAADRDQVVYAWQHYLPLVAHKPGALRNGAPFADLPEPLQRLRRALLQREGGDKVMARVLMAVPAHGTPRVFQCIATLRASTSTRRRSTVG